MGWVETPSHLGKDKLEICVAHATGQGTQELRECGRPEKEKVKERDRLTAIPAPNRRLFQDFAMGTNYANAAASITARSTNDHQAVYLGAEGLGVIEVWYQHL